MKSVNPYLIFEGDCQEAMEFYKSCFGGTLNVQSANDAPPGQVPPRMKDRLMHARLEAKGVVLMASDNLTDQAVPPSAGFQINIEAESKEEADRLFALLSKGGKVKLPLKDQFWGSYFGMLEDRFGVSWMMSFSQPH